VIEKVLKSDSCGYEDKDDGVIALAESDAIYNIQQREGLYHSQFSDRQDCKLFKPSVLYPRLREVLLEDMDVHDQ
jgi:hypothetical protein